uniref:dockerin type I domain-containing protein n=1 Tax=Ruminococcus sp. TaxID=41978 RepID=UPI00386C907F
IFGTSWNGNDTNNTMTFANDVWYKEYTVDSAKAAVQLKAVKNGETWIGDETGNNVTFNVTEAGTFTVYCDGTKTWVEGDNVEPISELDVQSVTAVGNGSPDGDNWLNKISWDPAAEANHMSKVMDGVYVITYTLGEYDPSDVEFKFAINDAWTDNFGLGDNGVIENGVETDAIYNGPTNLKITGLTPGTTIKMELNLINFDYNTKTGAKMTVAWGSDTPASILGDADGDGEVTAADAALIQRYDAQMPVGDNFNAALADVNGDGDVDILDVTLIQRYLAGMTVKYPIGNPAN